ncbi:MAG: 50S ribosomal protein L23 [Candidatus Krumholzibacteria bacterium]|nr:50S ribosomal protein L23 [Candidatus Krumholzibacteria bacterium]MDH4338122.1 50S ribosomal protein L23 [Candidatus Krumholzibacteria bacterium]MDH5270984.1 50S ribosomal protein L23 [Candidatus Krumholzibacteria bacterium]
MRTSDIRFIIDAPMLTEKSAVLKESKNRYVFRVDRNANKREIKEAVEKLFNVKVLDVRTAMFPGKMTVVMNKSGRFAGARKPWKKAYVTLAEGQTIEAFDIA